VHSRISGTGYARTGTVLAIGIIAAIQSYGHIYDLARTHGQSLIDARLLPLSVDGLIIAASLALLHGTAPVLARWVLALGIAATVSANVAYGLPSGALGAVVSAWPGISFVGAAELLLRGRSARATTRATTRVRRVETAVPRPVPVPVFVPSRPARAEAVPAGCALEDEFAAEIASGRIPGVKLIQRRMGGGQDTAYRHQARLRELAQPA
jgi:hypothetical protein